MNRAVRKEAGLPQQTVQHLLAQIQNLADPQRAALTGRERTNALAILDLALQAPRVAQHLVTAVVSAYMLKPGFGEALRAHANDPLWAKPYPLAVQEFTALVRRGPHLHVGLMGLVQQNAWPRQGLLELSEAIASGEGVAEAAGVLARDLMQIGEDLRVLIARLQEIKDIKSKSAMHVAQVETFVAAKHAKGNLRGLHTIDVGCGGAELIAAFAAAGAVATGTEVSDEHLLGVAEEPRYDVVTATALFEPGAFVWPELGVNTVAFEQHADAIITAAAGLLKKDGVLVVRNISCGMPFTARAAAEAGLRYERVLMPLATPSLGGRIAVWRKL